MHWHLCRSGRHRCSSARQDWARRHHRKLIAAAKAKRAGVLEVQFAGTDSKGGAACATVPLLAGGWHVA
ncbi:DUF5990 family protein [Acinetobacter haemolyticus]|uniref:DUF5990 family protein n=1 Tax=Acinetobacter haemolyticus TaxID=29430 RepID=UPI001C5C96DF